MLPGDTCWEWQWGRTKAGYGTVWDNDAKELLLAHRVSYRFYKGDITNNLHVLHRCDNPPCCNPSHLFLGTPKDNREDAFSKGRATIIGRKLTDEQAALIRYHFDSGVPQSKLANYFNVSPTTIFDIVRGNSYQTKQSWLESGVKKENELHDLWLERMTEK
jgi:hypothetical protein